MKKPTRSNAVIDINIAGQSWSRSIRAVKSVVKNAAEAALAAASLRSDVEVSVLLTSDSAVRKLNATYRGKDKPTNVLSFPAGSPSGAEPLALGDIAIAYGVVAREAKAENKTLSAHLSHLVVHGVLHLLGYDHEDDDKDATTMERLETKILARLGIKDPYTAPPAVKARPKRRKLP